MSVSTLMPLACTAGRVFSMIAERLFVIGLGHGESQIGGAVFAGVLYNHVDDDVRVRDGPENLRRQSRLIGNADQGDLWPRSCPRLRPKPNTSFMLSSSLTSQVPSASENDERTCTGTEKFLGKLHRANFQDLRSDARQLDHLVVGNPRQLSRLRTNSRISRKYTFDIGVNFACRGVEKSRQRHRAGVRAAASESGNIVIFVHALKAGDDDDIALVQRLHDLGRIDA